MWQLYSKLILLRKFCLSLYIELQEFGVLICFFSLCYVEMFSVRIFLNLEMRHKCILRC